MHGSASSHTNNPWPHLQDPDESNQDTDKRLADQFAHLTSLLKDAVPEVRAAAVAGVCRVLNEYWELIPGTITAGYMKLMAGERLPPRSAASS